MAGASAVIGCAGGCAVASERLLLSVPDADIARLKACFKGGRPYDFSRPEPCVWSCASYVPPGVRVQDMPASQSRALWLTLDWRGAHARIHRRWEHLDGVHCSLDACVEFSEEVRRLADEVRPRAIRGAVRRLLRSAGHSARPVVLEADPLVIAWPQTDPCRELVMIRYVTAP